MYEDSSVKYRNIVFNYKVVIKITIYYECI